jgi:hypothetical protein
MFSHNQPNHTLLLMPVKLDNERWPKNKVRILSCDAEGNLFTQMLARSTYQRIKKEAGQMDGSGVPYATVYWDTGAGKFTPLYIEIGEKESWALDRIMEHALKRAVIPDILRKYPGEIIKLGELKYKQKLYEKADRTLKVQRTSSRVLERLPYYRDDDIEISVPIYKAEYVFPLIVLKELPEAENTPPGQKPALVLDSEGDIIITNFPAEQVSKAKRKLQSLEKEGIKGYLICLKKLGGVSFDILETTQLQRRALDTITRFFEETGKGRHPLSPTVRKVLTKVRERR